MDFRWNQEFQFYHIYIKGYIQWPDFLQFWPKLVRFEILATSWLNIQIYHLVTNLIVDDVLVTRPGQPSVWTSPNVTYNQFQSLEFWKILQYDWLRINKSPSGQKWPFKDNDSILDSYTWFRIWRFIMLTQCDDTYLMTH